MGFLDPLFYANVVGFWGLYAAIMLGVSADWLYGESLYLAGCTYVMIRDWSAFSPAKIRANADPSPRLNNINGKTFALYRYWVFISALLGIMAMSLGLMGDERLSSSAARKIIDIITSIILAGKTFEYEAVANTIRTNQKLYLTAGLVAPFFLGASKSGGLSSLFWICQRWLNPTSAFFTFKSILQIKIRLLPIGLITCASLLTLLVAARNSGGAIETLLDILTTRLARNLDIYIFLDSLPESTVSKIVSESGGWIGGLLGGELSGASHNIGSLAKAYANNIAPDATGANPRLHALIVAMNGLGNKSTMLTLSVASIEIWCLSKLRKTQLCRGQIKATEIFNFVAWTSLINVFHADISSLKYGIVALISGNFLLRVRTSHARQLPLLEIPKDKANKIKLNTNEEGKV